MSARPWIFGLTMSLGVVGLAHGFVGTSVQTASPQDERPAAVVPPRPFFTVTIPGGLADSRRDVVRVSLPLPKGKLVRGDASLWQVPIRRVDTAGRPVAKERLVSAVCLEEWLQDGSVRVLQLHVPVTLEPQDERTTWTWSVDVARLQVRPRPAGGTKPVWAVGDVLPFVTELKDSWGRVWTALPRIVRQQVDLSSESSQVWRIEDVHGLRPAIDETSADASSPTDASPGEIPGLLGLSGTWVVTPGDAYGVLTLSLTNDRALGPIEFRSWKLVSRGQDFRFKPRFRADNLMRQPTPLPAHRLVGSDAVDPASGGFEQVLLGPAKLGIWLGDRTSKTFRFDVVLGANLDDAERSAIDERVVNPLVAIADLEWVRFTGAFGVAGGPAPRDALVRIASGGSLHSGSDAEGTHEAQAVEVAAAVTSPVPEWIGTLRRDAAWGPFGAFGDPRDAAASGTPRNGPCALQGILRWPDPALMAAAESMVLQQTLRPTPGVAPRLPGDTASFRRGIERGALDRPHGFTALDYEHASVDMLRDWWWLTGDVLARDELRRVAGGMIRVVDEVPFLTSRGEGWSMQSMVLVARAEGGSAGQRLVAQLADRFMARVAPELGKKGQPWVLKQPGHPRVFGDDVPFDAPWQMAAFVHGAVALRDALPLEHPARAALLAAILHAADVMATDGYVPGEGPKFMMSARGTGDYTMPLGHDAREHTAWMQVGAFVLAAERTDVSEDAALWLRRATHIAESVLAADVAPSDRQRAVENRWFQLLFDRALIPHDAR